MPSLTASAINCSLSAKGRKSSTDAMIAVLAEHFAEHDIEVGDPIRIAAHKVKWGVSSDEGDGDAWPAIRERILASDILIFGTPIWMGQPSSVAKLVLERMDAFLAETDEAGRMPSYSKVAVAAIVGNEDGAHHVCAELFQALNDVGWTIPAVAGCYWVGEAMGSVDFKNLDHRPRMITRTEDGGGKRSASGGPSQAITLSRMTLSRCGTAMAARETHGRIFLSEMEIVRREPSDEGRRRPAAARDWSHMAPADPGISA